MLMAAGLSADEAFDLLRRTSQLANRKLRDVAAGLVAQQATADCLDAPLERARRASLAMEHHRAALATLAVERAEATHEAIAGGMSRAEVARDLGITRQAVAKLLKHRGGDSRS
jgi:CRP-like cAMP-binding protein